MTATIDGLARTIGALRAAELAVFETLGAWALDPASAPEDRVAFAACAHRAAWRADQLAARAPALAALPPEQAAVLADDDLGRAATALPTVPAAERPDAARSIGGLLDAAYTAALAGVAPTDAPSRRLFHRLAHDVTLTD
jgi:hypothetical protein